MSKNQAPFLLLLLLFFLRPNDPSFQEPSMVMDMTFWFSLSIYFIFDFLFYEPSRYSRTASLMALVCLPHQTIRFWKVEWLSCIIRLGGLPKFKSSASWFVSFGCTNPTCSI